MINDDEGFDELLRNAAQDYNRPPAEIPRDEMWAGIEAGLAEKAARPLYIVPATPRRSLRTFTWLGAAVAAVLLIATGVGIGRWSTAPTQATPRSVASTRISPSAIPSAQPTGGGQPAAESGERTPDGGVQIAESGKRKAEGGERRADSGMRTADSGRRIANGGERVADNGSRRADNAQRSPGSSEVPYQVATIRHLANAEALLTAFRNDSRDAKMDAQLSKWARDLLSNTRLLLDSPAGDDPQRARLLGDLELVLAQIVQLSPGAAAQDRELIEGSIQQGQVMTRLRFAIPAGPTRGL